MATPSKESLEALTQSREKYDRTVKLLEDNIGKPITKSYNDYHVSGKLIPYGWWDCPLCKLYFDKGCRGCCIYMETGSSSCFRTPYWDYTAELRLSKTVTEGLIRDTKAERDYLADLEKRMINEVQNYEDD